jgi:hypothetical protein
MNSLLDYNKFEKQAYIGPIRSMLGKLVLPTVSKGLRGIGKGLYSNGAPKLGRSLYSAGTTARAAERRLPTFAKDFRRLYGKSRPTLGGVGSTIGNAALFTAIPYGIEMLRGNSDQGYNQDMQNQLDELRQLNSGMEPPSASQPAYEGPETYVPAGNYPQSNLGQFGFGEYNPKTRLTPSRF